MKLGRGTPRGLAAFHLKQNHESLMRNPLLPTKALVLAALASVAIGVTACGPSSSHDDYDDNASQSENIETDTADQIDEPVMPQPPVVVENTDTAPVETLPPEVRSSEETVQPDSETLFY